MHNVHEPARASGSPPRAFLVGAQKAGTTFLSALLDQHPGITLSVPKEPHYFTLNWKRGPEWYAERFSGAPDSILLDASTSYTGARLPEYDGARCKLSNPFSDVPRKIHLMSPDARFIYLLRNPVDRTYSSYWHDAQKGRETRPFRQAITEDSSYLRKSAYLGQLSLYLEVFDISSFLFLPFEQFKHDPIGTARKCFRFLGIEEDVDLCIKGGRNESFAYRGFMQSTGKLLGWIDPLVKTAKPLIPSQAKLMLRQMLTKPIPQIKEEDRVFLMSHFKDKNEQLENRIRIPLRQWWY